MKWKLVLECITPGHVLQWGEAKWNLYGCGTENVGLLTKWPMGMSENWWYTTHWTVQGPAVVGRKVGIDDKGSKKPPRKWKKCRKRVRSIITHCRAPKKFTKVVSRTSSNEVKTRGHTSKDVHPAACHSFIYGWAPGSLLECLSMAERFTKNRIDDWHWQFKFITGRHFSWTEEGSVPFSIDVRGR